MRKPLHNSSTQCSLPVRSTHFQHEVLHSSTKHSLNILIITRYLFQESAGGVERVLWGAAKELAKRGNTIHIISTTENNKPPESKAIDGINIHGFFCGLKNPLLSYIYRTRKINKIYKELVKNVNFDIINIHGSGMLHSLLPSIGNTPLVYSFHASHPNEIKFDFTREMLQKIGIWQKLKLSLRFPLYYYRYKWTENKSLRRADAILTDSDFDRREILQSYGRRYIPKTKVIPCGLDTERFKPSESKEDIRDRLCLPKNRIIFFTVRNLKPRMGLENLIVATSKVVKENGDILVVIGGKGILFEKLNSLIEELGLQDNIKLAGFIEEELLPCYYQAVDAFILPTEELEGFGIVTIEALSSNLPVIGTPAGATPEILNQITPDLITKDISPDAIADTMLYFIRNLHTFTKRDIYRRLVMERYDWRVVGEKIETFFQEVRSSL